MTKSIWKFKVDRTEVVLLPEGAKVLSVGVQGNDLVLWALVNPKAKSVEALNLKVIPTGDMIPDGEVLDFIGTVHFPGPLVFHVFRRV